jgi:hypothetical protein
MLKPAKMKPLPGSSKASKPKKPSKPSKEEMSKFMKENELYKVGGPRLLKGRESPLSKIIKKFVTKKSGAGYSGD